MNIEIKKLIPELAEDYVEFFDKTPHWDNIDCHKCYCVCWASTDHNAVIKEDGGTVVGRREIAKRYIKNGYLQGYLAYHNDKIVGWCNANTKADCLHSYSWENFMKSVDTDMDKPDIKIKSVFCFVIVPDMQRKGIATKLLEKVCIDAANDDFDFVEAYPKKSFVNIAENFMGPAEMYKKCGFTAYGETTDMLIMQKKLSEQIEVGIAQTLIGDERKNALKLVASLKINDMQFERSTTNYWADRLYWHIKFKDEFVGFILINGYNTVGDETEPDGWIFWTDDYTSDIFADYALEKHTKEIAWNHVDFGTCGGGVKCKLFGKEFYPVCNGTTFRFNNPGTDELECLEKLIEIQKNNILNKRSLR